MWCLWGEHLGWSLWACDWDSPVIDIQGCQLRREVCNSLQPQERESPMMTLPAANLPSHCLCQPLSLSMSHIAYRPCLFRNIFFHFSLSMEAQNSNNNNNKKTLLHCLQNHTWAGAGYRSPCRNQEEGVAGVSEQTWIFACI